MKWARRFTRYSVLICVTASLTWQTAGADTIWLKGAQDPVFGLLQSKNSEGILVFDRFSQDHTALTRVEIPVEQIEMVIRTVDQQRLSKLQTTNWLPWIEYAEELSAHQLDPLAKQLAVRLLILCLFHGSQQDIPDPILKSAALNLLNLADSEVQRRTYRQIAWFYAGVESNELTPNTDNLQSPETPRILLRMTQAVRKQQYNRAASILRSAEFKFSIIQTQFPALVSAIQKSIDEQTVADPLLARILELELRSRFKHASRIENPANRFERPKSRILYFDSLQEIAPFDLQATIFRDGAWQIPTAQEPFDQ